MATVLPSPRKIRNVDRRNVERNKGIQTGDSVGLPTMLLEFGLTRRHDALPGGVESARQNQNLVWQLVSSTVSARAKLITIARFLFQLLPQSSF